MGIGGLQAVWLQAPAYCGSFSFAGTSFIIEFTWSGVSFTGFSAAAGAEL
jgi:hypothetical protein